MRRQARDETRATRLIILMAWLVSTVWVIAFIPSLLSALASHSAWRISLALVGLALFLAIYLPATGADAREFAMTSASPPQPLWLRALPAILLTILGFVMISALDVSWGTLFIFAVVAAARRLEVIPALVATALLTAVPLLGLARGALDLGPAAQAAGTVAVVGVTVIGMRWSFITNRNLRSARRELARLAITEERLRFARDLHDLLGHTLSLIALKSELAGRLARSAPERAEAELAGIGAAAREALRDVRAAVAGYRQVTLAGELEAARDLLAAAGITSAIHGAEIQPPPGIEAALAWAVRESSANVIRHSRARSCLITLSEDNETGGHYTLLVEDDGRGVAAEHGDQTPGNGLRGLAERAASLGGTLSAGPQAAGGYALRLALPAGARETLGQPGGERAARLERSARR